MYRVMKFETLLKSFAVATVAISVLAYYIIHTFLLPDYSLFKVILISSTVSAILLIALTSSFSSRKIWALLLKFNNELYPDLNGTWEGAITTSTGEKMAMRAVIRQSLLSTYIDMHGETVKSITLEATPVTKQGQKHLYYMYHATPKDPRYHPYNGSTIFQLRKVNDGETCCLELTGQYYTDRASAGRIELRQTDSDPTNDVSFY